MRSGRNAEYVRAIRIAREWERFERELMECWIELLYGPLVLPWRRGKRR